MDIPSQFECMGMTVTVTVGKCAKGMHGEYHANDNLIKIGNLKTEELRASTFWHEFVHCALTTLGYNELNDNEQFVEQMAQCIYQCHKTAK